MTLDHPFHGPYAQVADIARLEYGRIFGKVPRVRARLLRHWTDPRHPYSHRFMGTYRSYTGRVLEADPANDAALEEQLRAEGQSLRVIVREIPPVFGSFFHQA